jgi:hypothetical protein
MERHTRRVSVRVRLTEVVSLAEEALTGSRLHRFGGDLVEGDMGRRDEQARWRSDLGIPHPCQSPRGIRQLPCIGAVYIAPADGQSQPGLLPSPSPAPPGAPPDSPPPAPIERGSERREESGEDDGLILVVRVTCR